MSTTYRAIVICAVQVEESLLWTVKTNGEQCQKGHMKGEIQGDFCPKCGGRFREQSVRIPTQALSSWTREPVSQYPSNLEVEEIRNRWHRPFIFYFNDNYHLGEIAGSMNSDQMGLTPRATPIQEPSPRMVEMCQHFGREKQPIRMYLLMEWF